MSAFVVEKRDGTLQRIHFDKITERLERLSKGLDHVEPVIVAQKVIQGIYSGIKTTELDNLAAETAAYMGTVHPEYGMLAARVCISNHQKETKDSFLELATELREYINPKNNTHSPLLSEEVFSIISRNADAIQERLDYERDYMFDYFGFKTLMRSYLLRVNGTVVERPQHMWMRVSIGIHQEDLESAFKTYDLMSRGIFTHASPTLFNAGTCRSQCSSCFLLSMTDDSIEGIFETLDRCARISKTAGGIGLNVNNIRASGSYIAGTNGTSNGLVPMLRVYNATARYVDQGGGKRKGAFAIYIEPWHADIESVIDLKKNTGAEEQRARDLFYALWVPDLFMKRVQADADWSLFCPNQCPGLADSHSEAFEKLYLQYEAEGKAHKVVRAQDLWFKILESQIETGGPYMLFKDACNSKSNQQNLGTIKGSNLCTEIIQYTSPDEVAVCNLASVALPRFIRYSGEGKEGPYFAFDEFVEVVKQMTRNLNQVIDINYYPVEQARTSNMKHRPIGLGVQGLADTFILMRFPFESPEARQLNTDIFEALYYAAVSASCEAAEKDGPYASFDGSPASKGQLQFDLWGVTPSSGRFDWAALKERIAKYGLRNSLLVAPMPTASTAQILGNVEAFEPFHSNMFSRRVLAGEFAVINKHLIRDLDELGIWCEEIKNAIVAGGGSVQAISQIPLEIRQLYKTVWEIKQSHLVKMAADRGPYIDQSASLNIFMAEPTFNKVTSLHFATWKAGLKTGLYYLRSRPAANAIQFTVDSKSAAAVLDKAPTTPVKKNTGASKLPVPESPALSEGAVCYMEEGCLSCGS